MARRDGDGGGFALGWTLLGFLAGVAATLGIQILMSGNSPPASNPQTAVVAPSEATSALVVPHKPHKKAPAPSLAAISSAPSASAAQSQSMSPEVAEDAAAAGMTSRVSPSAQSSDTANN